MDFIIATSECELVGSSTQCVYKTDNNIDIIFLPFFVIILLVTVLLMLKIFNFNNHWKK